MPSTMPASIRGSPYRPMYGSSWTKRPMPWPTKLNGRPVQLLESSLHLVVDVRPARPVAGRLEDEVAACDDIRPDLGDLGSRFLDHRGSAYPGVITVEGTEHLQATMSPRWSFLSVGPTLGNWLRSPLARMSHLKS